METRFAFDMLADKGAVSKMTLDLIYADMFAVVDDSVNYDEAITEEMASVAAFILGASSRKNQSPFVRSRLCWDDHAKKLLREGEFRNMYRMSYNSFCKLVELLRPSLTVNEVQARRRSSGEDPIYTEIILHCLIRYMAGGASQDIRVTAGMTKRYFYSCVHRGIDAVNNCATLNLIFPTSEEKLKETAVLFQRKSSFGELNGCISALDGWLCRILIPSPKETPNVSSYFSGHYQCYGVNVQAACDSSSRFTWISIRSPGGTGDSKAFYGTSLHSLLSTLPEGYYIVADNAYTLSKSLLVPYSGNDKRFPSRDVFNFYLSQLRIKIEQAFGMMVNKWRVFKKPLQLGLARVPTLIECCVRLHNYCIEQREADWCIPDVVPELISTHVPSYDEYKDELNSETSSSGGRNTVRTALTKQLLSNGRMRPMGNVRRNN
jgi:hypothetical protein